MYEILFKTRLRMETGKFKTVVHECRTNNLHGALTVFNAIKLDKKNFEVVLNEVVENKIQIIRRAVK